MTLLSPTADQSRLLYNPRPLRVECAESVGSSKEERGVGNRVGEMERRIANLRRVVSEKKLGSERRIGEMERRAGRLR